MPTSIWQLLESSARKEGARTAIEDGSRSWTYAQWHENCRNLAKGLFDIGLRPGDRLAIHAANCEEYLSLYFAAAGSGLILVPLNNRLTDSELRAILDDSGCSLVLGKGDWSFGEERHTRLIQARGEGFEPLNLPGDAIAQIYYTSGTTGRPKGVMLSHQNVLSHASMSIAALELCKDDVWGHIAPLFHLADAWATFAITAVGGCHVTQAEFDAGSTLKLIAEKKISITNLVPTMLNRMVKHPEAGNHSYASLRLLLSGGAPIASAVVEEIDRVFGCEYV
ncbi:MAG: class I adenylate-forming enzyme family protein, partial [Planctomycetota bacterium]